MWFVAASQIEIVGFQNDSMVIPVPETFKSPGTWYLATLYIHNEIGLTTTGKSERLSVSIGE